MSLKIGILPGDDIGLEVVPECVKVMKAAAARECLAIDWHPLPIGKLGLLQRLQAALDVERRPRRVLRERFSNH